MRGDQRSVWGGRYRFLVSLEKQLDSLTLAGTWRVLLFSIVTIALADYQLYPTGVHLGPLYMLPICFACWRLSFRVGLAVAAGTALLLVGTCFAISGEITGAMFGNLALHVLSLVIIAIIVTGLRHSFEREREQARRDYTTGVLTKCAFEQHAGAIVRAGRTDLLLVVLDLDGFKDVNDRHGHSVGDGLLRVFSQGAAAELRAKDSFGRLGGDEFAILLPIAAPDSAPELARTLHRRLSEILAETGHAVTCSMGALIVPAGDKRPLAELVQAADRLMYVAKHSGKNAVQVATCAPPLDPAGTWLPLASGNGMASLALEKARRTAL